MYQRDEFSNDGPRTVDPNFIYKDSKYAPWRTYSAPLTYSTIPIIKNEIDKQTVEYANEKYNQFKLNKILEAERKFYESVDPGLIGKSDEQFAIWYAKNIANNAGMTDEDRADYRNYLLQKMQVLRAPISNASANIQHTAYANAQKIIDPLKLSPDARTKATQEVTSGLVSGIKELPGRIKGNTQEILTDIDQGVGSFFKAVQRFFKSKG